jgi:WD40 repeat protein
LLQPTDSKSTRIPTWLEEAEKPNSARRFKMKKWAILTVLLYATIVLLLAGPVVLICFAGETHLTALRIFQGWFFWMWFTVLIIGQVLLLLLPIDISERRLTSRRQLKLPVIVTAFFLASLFFLAFLSILCVLFKDQGILLVNADYELQMIKNAFAQNKKEATVHANDVFGWGFWLGAVGMTAIFWCFWGMVFYRRAKNDDPKSLVKRCTQWLLRGSILELLVAVPSHIIVRRRDDCCAPLGTFWGITTGISIMLLCFGPGVFFLFVERINRKRPSIDTNAPRSVPGKPGAEDEDRRERWSLAPSVLAAVVGAGLVFVLGGVTVLLLNLQAPPVPPEEALRPPPQPPPPPAAPPKNVLPEPPPVEDLGKLGRTQLRHGDYVYRLQFTRDGKALLSEGGAPGVWDFRLWDVATGELRHVFEKGADRSRLRRSGACLAPDGKHLATPGLGGVNIWNLETGRKLQTFGADLGELRFSPDGKILAGFSGASTNLQVELWDPAAGRHLRSWQVGPVTCLAFTPDGKSLITSGRFKFAPVFTPRGYDNSQQPDYPICLWDVASGKEQRCFRVPHDNPMTIALSPRGDLLAALCPLQSTWSQSRIRFLDVRSGTINQWTWELAPAGKDTQHVFTALAFSPDGKTLFTGGRLDSAVTVWDLSTRGRKELRRVVRERLESPRALAVSPGGKILAVNGPVGEIHLIDLR